MKTNVYLNLFLTLIVCINTEIAFAKSSPQRELTTQASPKCAILLHGLARSAFSMRSLRKSLERTGYLVWNESYPSTEKAIEDLSPIISEGIQFCENNLSPEIFFVSHSMGGILIRHFFQNHEDPRVKAIVMLAPPNHGSEIADAFKTHAWFRWLNGPAGQQLETDKSPQSFLKTLKPIKFPIGIITGTKSSDPWFSYLFKGPNDGKVSVESAKLDEMSDFLTINAGHTFIMNSKTVQSQILHFLNHKKFQH